MYVADITTISCILPWTIEVSKLNLCASQVTCRITMQTCMDTKHSCTSWVCLYNMQKPKFPLSCKTYYPYNLSQNTYIVKPEFPSIRNPYMSMHVNGCIVYKGEFYIDKTCACMVIKSFMVCKYLLSH